MRVYSAGTKAFDKESGSFYFTQASIKFSDELKQ